MIEDSTTKCNANHRKSNRPNKNKSRQQPKIKKRKMIT